MSNYYLSKTDGTSKAYFTVNPVPLPDLVPGRRVIEKEIMPGLSGGSPVDGGLVYYDVGTHISRNKLDITVPFVTETIKNNIKTLFELSPTQSLYYSPDNGTNIWEVCWADGDPFIPSRAEGVSDRWRLEMHFRVLAKVV